MSEVSKCIKETVVQSVRNARDLVKNNNVNPEIRRR